MKLIRYKDIQDKYYIYFWISSDEQILSPDFRSPEEAEEWLTLKKEKFKSQIADSMVYVDISKR